MVLRGFLGDGKPDAAVQLFDLGVKVYPFLTRENPPAMERTLLSGVVMNTVHSNDFSYCDEVALVIAKEPIDLIDPETRGLLASIGITKDAPFAPDERMRRILTDAAAVGNGTARAIAIQPRDADFPIHDDRRWASPFPGGDYRFLRDGGAGGPFLDANEALRDGAKSYRLRLPADMPTLYFWSVGTTGRPAPSCRPVMRRGAAAASGMRWPTTRTASSRSSTAVQTSASDHRLRLLYSAL